MKGTRRTAVVGLGTVGLMALAAPGWALGPLPGPDAPAVSVVQEAVDPLPTPEPSPSDDPVTALLPEPVKGLAAPITRQVVALVLPAPKPTPTTAPERPAPQPVALPMTAPAAGQLAPVQVALTAAVARSLPRTDSATQPVASQQRLDHGTGAAGNPNTGGPRTAPLAFPRPIPPGLAVPSSPVSPGLPAAVVAIAMAMVTAAGAGQLAEVRSRR